MAAKNTRNEIKKVRKKVRK